MDNKPIRLVDSISRLKSQGASDKDIKREFNRYIEIHARNNLVPLHGQFELTPFCNLDCKMCYVHLNGLQFDNSSLLSVDILKKIINDAHNAGMLHTTLTGGECLTYPWFNEVYLFCRENGIVPTVLTNGVLLDSERIAFFSKYPPSLIQVTLYGSSDNAYEKVTGHRVFNTVYHNLEQLRESKIRVSLALTPSSFMSDDIRPLLEAAISLNIPFGINANLITPREQTGRKLEDLQVEQYIVMYRVWKELKKEDLLPIDAAELPDENHGGEKAYGLQCGGGRSSFTIQYNGKMSPCPSLSEVTTEPLVEGFQNAWRRLNTLVKEYPMPAECTDCVYHDYCLICPAIHNNAHNPGHCDPRICERTKRLIQEGFIKLENKAEG
ncbi:MAG: radical SAM protein [Clostridia bacterium]|nr:radical SAM protein [Clostridia bacterium]